MLTPICVFLLVAFQLVLIFLREVGCSRYIFYSDSAYFFVVVVVVVVVGGVKADLLTCENSQCTTEYYFFGKGDRKSIQWLFEKRLGLSDRMILDYCRATEASI